MKYLIFLFLPLAANSQDNFQSINFQAHLNFTGQHPFQTEEKFPFRGGAISYYNRNISKRTFTNTGLKLLFQNITADQYTTYRGGLSPFFTYGWYWHLNQRGSILLKAGILNQANLLVEKKTSTVSWKFNSLLNVLSYSVGVVPSLEWVPGKSWIIFAGTEINAVSISISRSQVDDYNLPLSQRTNRQWTFSPFQDSGIFAGVGFRW